MLGEEKFPKLALGMWGLGRERRDYDKNIFFLLFTGEFHQKPTGRTMPGTECLLGLPSSPREGWPPPSLQNPGAWSSPSPKESVACRKEAKVPSVTPLSRLLTKNHLDFGQTRG